MTGHTRLAAFSGLAVALGAMSLLPVVSGGEWFILSLVGLALVFGAGELCRRLRLARSVVPLAQLAVIIFFLTARFAGDEAILGFFPGGRAIEALSDVVRTGFDDISKYAPPVPGNTGIVALAVGGVCIVGLLVDLLAVTLRRAALAGLPLLALYSVSAAVVTGGVHWLIFACAGFGYLALLLTEGRDRVSHWGRPLRVSTGDGRVLANRALDVETSPLTQVGRRIGAAALGLALVVPALVPNVTYGLLAKGGGGFGSGGSHRIATVNPISSLRQDLNLPENLPLIHVTTDNPQGEQQYLRDATLDEFDGDTWRPSKAPLTDIQNPLPAPDGLSEEVARTNVHTEISVVDSFKSQWLLMPQPAVGVDVKGRWRYNPRGHDIIGDRRQTTAGLRYTVDSLDIAPTIEQLEAAGSEQPQNMSRYLNLPEMPALVRQMALDAVGNADTPYDKAVRLQDWFLDKFEYSTSVQSGHSTSLIEDFLRKKKGYCEQFAATMAVMARILGIPARVAVGFTAGEKLSDGTFVIKAHDRHAWPELYFTGVGWIRFEPTPSIAGTNGHGSTPAWAQAGGIGRDPEGSQSGLDTSTGSTSTQSPCAAQHQARFDCDLDREQTAIEAQQQPPAASGGGSFPVIPVGLAAVALVLLAMPRLVRTTTRRRRLAHRSDPEQRIRAAWAELRDVARDLGYAWDPAETPRQMADRLCREGELSGPAADGVRRVARAAERLRYARSAGPVGDLFVDVDAARAGLAARVSRLVRWRAELLPPSSAALLAGIGGSIADLLDWLDSAGARLRARLVPRRGGATP